MNAIKKMVLNSVVRSCGPLALTATSCLPRILMYHGFCEEGHSVRGGVESTVFRDHLRYIKRNFTPWKLSDLIDHFCRHGKYPNRAVCITVDDGYENFYTIALPLLREFEIPATLFVVAEATDRSQMLWPDIVALICEKTNRDNECSRLQAKLKKVAPAQRESILGEMLRESGLESPHFSEPEYQLISWDQLRKTHRTGLVEIGSHSCTHPTMVTLNEEESRREIIESKRMIEAKLQIPVTSFCYPNGQVGDYTEQQKQLLQDAGYICSVASHAGLVNCQSDLYALPRLAYHPTNLTMTRLAWDGFVHLHGNLLRRA